MKREVEEQDDDLIFDLIERSGLEREYAYIAQQFHWDAVLFEKIYNEIRLKRFPKEMKETIKSRAIQLYVDAQRMAMNTDAVPEMALKSISESRLN